MKFFLLPAALLLMNIAIFAQSAKELSDIWEKEHVSRMPPSQVRHADLKNYLEELRKLGIKVEEVGRSFGNREIYQAEWGRGGQKIFMWSQMHGDEPTATSALIDLFAFLQTNRNLAWVKEIENAVTIRIVPMLNPDGAELFQRRNLQSIDINRDARALQTPEGRLLKQLRDEWQPDLGFNLHNQNALTPVGNTGRQATVSFLAVSGDPDGKSNAAHIRGKRISAVMIRALENFIEGHIGRYDDEYNPRAFGDMISAWGTPVILVETGALHGRDEMFLTKLNFVAYLSMLRAVARGEEVKFDPAIYDRVPENGDTNLNTLIFRGASVVNQAQNGEPFAVDIAINAERRRAGAESAAYVAEVGDLSVFRGLDEYDAGDFYVVAKTGQIRNGYNGDLLFYRKTSAKNVNWSAPDLETAFPPDAVFSKGKWTKGEKLLRKKNN